MADANLASSFGAIKYHDNGDTSYAPAVFPEAQYLATPPTLSPGATSGLQADSNANLKVTLATALNQAIDSVLTYSRGYNYVQTSTSIQVLNTAGKLMGVFVSSASATPTIKIWDSQTGSGLILIDTFTPTPGTMYHFNSIRVLNGIYLTLGGTISCTAFFDPITT